MHFKYFIIPALLTLLASQGCSNNDSIFSKDNLPLVHRIDIQQGNVIDQNMLAQLEPGMDQKKVLYIMGTPLIKDTFHNNRWDYVYTFKEGRDVREQRRVTLYFDKDKKLSRVGGDVRRASGKIELESRVMEKIEVPEADPDTILSKVKQSLSFGDDEPLISDEPEVEEQVESTSAKVEKATETVEKDTTEIVTEPDSKPESTSEQKLEEDLADDATDQELDEEEIDETPASEKSGLFDKVWSDKENGDINRNDPILNDPVLNPDY